MADAISSEAPLRLVIRHANVVDPRSGSVAKDKTMVVENGKILTVANEKSTLDGTIIDATGKYLVPGYLDMHAHPLNSPDPVGSLKLMLANGITGVRQMSGSSEQLSRYQWRQSLFPGQPELLGMSGEILNDMLTPTPEAAAAEVQKQQDEGADFIKQVGLSSEPFFGSLREARELGMGVNGHIHHSIDVRKASDMGLQNIDHLGAGAGLLLSCSSKEDALRSMAAQTPLSSAPVDAGSVAAQNAIGRTIANPILFSSPSDIDRMSRCLETFDEGKARGLASLFVKNGTWQTPTLIRLRTMELGDDPQYLNDPNLRYAAPESRTMWAGLGREFSEKITDANHEMLRRFFQLQMRLTKIFHDAGVPMLAGSDFGGQWVISGFGLHQEFDLLAQAGLSPLDILRMTTINGAAFLGREDTMGTVEAGKNADMVLLDANPLDSVDNLHRIHAVIRAGQFYSREDLDAILESVK